MVVPKKEPGFYLIRARLGNVAFQGYRGRWKAMIIISAMGQNRVIGAGSGMPWNVPGNRPTFKSFTGPGRIEGPADPHDRQYFRLRVYEP